jgi:hypothetical protein
MRSGLRPDDVDRKFAALLAEAYRAAWRSTRDAHPVSDI